MNVKADVQVSIDGPEMEVHTFLQFEDHRQMISKMVIDTEQDAIVEGLRKLGWKDPNYTPWVDVDERQPPEYVASTRYFVKIHQYVTAAARDRYGYEITYAIYTWQRVGIGYPWKWLGEDKENPVLEWMEIPS